MLSQKQYDSAKTALMSDLADAAICTTSSAVVKQAVDLLESTTLRVVESLHIGCALEWKSDLFASADIRQITAGKHAGLENNACITFQDEAKVLLIERS